MRGISLLLGVKGQAGLAGELEFPVREVYPTLSEFRLLYLDGFPLLSSIQIWTEGDSNALTGIQLSFANGSKSKLISMISLK